MIDVAFRRLEKSDAETLSNLLKSAPSDYTKYFHPFSFETDSVKKVISNAKKDVLTAVEIRDGQNVNLAGFYMLRGLDEGYLVPMYGVFIGHKYQNKGIGRLTLVHAESSCRLSQIDRLMLKVHPHNTIARTLYEAHGFTALKEDPRNQNIIME